MSVYPFTGPWQLVAIRLFAISMIVVELVYMIAVFGFP